MSLLPLALLSLAGCIKDDPTGDSAVEICDDGVDNDGDGQADCDDDDCAGLDACAEAGLEDCADGADNDGDGDIDCADSDCADLCDESAQCDDDVDNDGDGLIDCQDEDCADLDECIEDCSDGVDNDDDGFIDCFDNDCSATEACVEDCADGVDNDGDGRTDCEDAECFGDAACGEACDDGVDNDGDGFVDCEDDDCWGTAVCLETRARVTSHGGGSGFVSLGQSVVALESPGGAYTYSGAVNIDNSVAFRSIDGEVSVQTSSGTLNCDWSVDLMQAGRTKSFPYSSGGYSMAYYQDFGMDLIARSGFKTSGACGGLDSGFLPQRFQLAYYSGIAAAELESVNFSSWTGPLWYAATMRTGENRYSSFETSYKTSAGGYFYSYAYQVTVPLKWGPGGAGSSYISE